MITYTWTIEPLECIISIDGLNNVVQSVPWRYKGEDENGTIYEPLGVQFVSSPNPSSFTPFEELTNAIVITWLESMIDMVVLQQQIQEQIYILNNPTKIILTLNS